MILRLSGLARKVHMLRLNCLYLDQRDSQNSLPCYRLLTLILSYSSASRRSRIIYLLNPIAVCAAFTLYSFIDKLMDGRTEKSIFYSSKQPFYLGKMLPKPRQSTIDLHLAPGKKKEKLSDLVFCFCFPDPCPLFGVVMMDGGEGGGGAPL